MADSEAGAPAGEKTALLPSSKSSVRSKVLFVVKAAVGLCLLCPLALLILVILGTGNILALQVAHLLLVCTVLALFGFKFLLATKMDARHIENFTIDLADLETAIPDQLELCKGIRMYYWSSLKFLGAMNVSFLVIMLSMLAAMKETKDIMFWPSIHPTIPALTCTCVTLVFPLVDGVFSYQQAKGLKSPPLPSWLSTLALVASTFTTGVVVGEFGAPPPLRATEAPSNALVALAVWLLLFVPIHLLFGFKFYNMTDMDPRHKENYGGVDVKDKGAIEYITNAENADKLATAIEVYYFALYRMVGRYMLLWVLVTGMLVIGMLYSSLPWWFISSALIANTITYVPFAIYFRRYKMEGLKPPPVVGNMWFFVVCLGVQYALAIAIIQGF